MGGCHDIFVIDHRRAAVEFSLVREHGHPRVLVHVRGGTADDSVFLTQSSASLNNKKNYVCIRDAEISTIIRGGAVVSRFSAVTEWLSLAEKHRGPPCIRVNLIRRIRILTIDL